VFPAVLTTRGTSEGNDGNPGRFAAAAVTMSSIAATSVVPDPMKSQRRRVERRLIRRGGLELIDQRHVFSTACEPPRQ
jgi:hypothetical protein